MLKPLGSRSFTLKTSMLWTIHEFPRYGVVARVIHQGYCACPICGPNSKGEHFVELGKNTHISTCRWLAVGHPYKSTRMKGHFNVQLEKCIEPKSVIAKEQLA